MKHDSKLPTPALIHDQLLASLRPPPLVMSESPFSKWEIGIHLHPSFYLSIQFLYTSQPHQHNPPVSHRTQAYLLEHRACTKSITTLHGWALLLFTIIQLSSIPKPCAEWGSQVCAAGTWSCHSPCPILGSKPPKWVVPAHSWVLPCGCTVFSDFDSVIVSFQCHHSVI